MVSDLLAGQIKVGIVTLTVVKAYLSDARLKIIAIGEKTRFAGTPQVPVIAETLPGFELTTWLGFFGPGKLPGEIAQQLSEQLVQALNTPAVKGKLIESGLPLRAQGPAGSPTTSVRFRAPTPRSSRR